MPWPSGFLRGPHKTGHRPAVLSPLAPPPLCSTITAATAVSPRKPSQATSAPWGLMFLVFLANWMSPGGSSIKSATLGVTVRREEGEERE